MNHVRIYYPNRFCYPCRSSSKLAEKGGAKTLSLTYPHTEKSRDVKSGDIGGRAIVPTLPIQAKTVRLRQEVNS